MNPQTPASNWDAFRGIALVALMVVCVPLWPVFFIVICWNANNGVDLRINDPVLDHRDHLGACRQPRVGQGQGGGLI